MGKRVAPEHPSHHAIRPRSPCHTREPFALEDSGTNMGSFGPNRQGISPGLFWSAPGPCLAGIQVHRRQVPFQRERSHGREGDPILVHELGPFPFEFSAGTEAFINRGMGSIGQKMGTRSLFHSVDRFPNDDNFWTGPKPIE